MIQPVSDVESERSLIGCLMIEPSKTLNVMNVMGVSSEWFYDPMIRAMYDASIMSLFNGMKIDMVIIRQFLPKEYIGSEYVGKVASWCDQAVPAHAMHYVKILKEKYEIRCIQSVLLDGMQEIHTIRDPKTFISETRHKLSIIGGHQEDISMNAPIENIKKIAINARNGIFMNVKSRWSCLQKAINGYPRGLLTVIAASPGMGKSTFVNNETTHAALHCGIPVAIASMEMTKEQWLINSACAEAQVSAALYMTGQLLPEEYDAVEAKLELLRKAPLFISDKNHSIESLCSFIRDMSTDHKCQMIIIDHLGRIAKKGKKSTTEETTEISNAIISTAKDCRNTAIIGISPLNKTPPGVKMIELDMNRLRDSGALGFDAATVLLMYPAVDPDSVAPDADLEMTIKIEKNRFGQTGKRGLLFRRTLQKFVE